MKNSKTILRSALTIALFSIMLISGCKKEEDDNGNNEQDWATPLIGVYTHDELISGTSYHSITTFSVTRQSNKIIELQIDRPAAGSFVSRIHSCFDSVQLNSANTLVVNETDSCAIAFQNASLGMSGYYISAKGNGTFSPNSLTISWASYSRFMNSDSDTTNYSFIATK